jgi:isopenicillin N synthase-like dioxygenase
MQLRTRFPRSLCRLWRVGAMAATTLAVLPVVDLTAFLAGDASDPAVQDACRAVAECLRDTGALIVRDPRVNAQDNSRFLDMVEAYFGQPHEEKLADVHPELSYQARAVCLRLTSC